ncbi:MAG TPA: PilZ domain-containing protein [Thermoanaerobaculia bacterium]|jgi:hypothetical protein|nr:PilZ domain-containing protein [Thermoanaerobaculia bacterium]
MEPLTSLLARDEAPRKLELDRQIIDALIGSGAVRCRVADGQEMIPLGHLEAFFRDALLRLYRSEASEAPGVAAAHDEKAREPLYKEIDFDVDEDQAQITRSIREFEEPVTEKPDLRIAVRYIPRGQIGGMFNQVKFTVLQISNTGLRIRHQQTLLPGEEAKLTFSLLKASRSFAMRAKVVWTSIAQRGDDPTFCISGLRVTETPDRLCQAVDVLRDKRELQADMATTRRPQSGKTPPALRGVTDEEVALVLKTIRRFASDPIEANRWYARARVAAADEAVRRVAPQRASDREQVLGIWEYLNHSVEIPKIAGIVSWTRNYRTAVA